MLEADTPVKNAPAGKRRTSTPPAKIGTDVATALALEIASALVAPIAKKTVTKPSLTTLNWPQLVSVALTGACTAVGAVGVAAVKLTVGPSGRNGICDELIRMIPS